MPTVASKLTEIASFQGVFYDPDSIFLIHGKDFSIKLPKSTGASQTDYCVTSPLVAAGAADALVGKTAVADFTGTDGSAEFT